MEDVSIYQLLAYKARKKDYKELVTSMSDICTLFKANFSNLEKKDLTFEELFDLRVMKSYFKKLDDFTQECFNDVQNINNKPF